MTIVELTPRLDPAWRDYVSTHPDRTVYHTLGWRDLLVETYGYSPSYLLAMDGETVAGALPLMRFKPFLGRRRITSLPFSHWVPLLADGPAGAALLERAVGLAQKSSSQLIVKAPGALGPGFGTVLRNMDTTVDLSPSIEDVWKRVVSAAQRSTRKAEKRGIVIRTEVTADGIEQYERLECETRKRQGAPPYPKGFFHRLFRLVEGAGLFLAELEGAGVGGLVLLPSGRTLVYGYGGSNAAGQGAGANDLLTWRAIQHAKEQGFERYDFGTTPVHHESLLKFKEKWGGETIELPYSVWPATASAGPKRDGRAVKLVSEILRRSPDAVFRTLGPWLLKQVG